MRNAIGQAQAPEQEASLTSRERLKILEETRDGFRIADEDLKLCGPAEVLGTQQSGLPSLAFPEFLSDTKLVQQAKGIAEGMIEGETGSGVSG